MSRSVKKSFYVSYFLLEKLEKKKKDDDKTPIVTYSRRSTIIPEFVGLTFKVHNGREFKTVYITENMVGHKLGEFSFTRNFPGHTQNR